MVGLPQAKTTKLISDRAARRLSDQETRPGEEACTFVCQESKGQIELCAITLLFFFFPRAVA